MANFPKSPPAIGRSIGLVGATGLTGATGNGAVFQSVDALSGSPRSVVDWGPIINTALATATTRNFIFGPYDYPFTTMINGASTMGITFKGAGGVNWFDPGAGHGQTRLVWGGTGSGYAIDFSSPITGNTAPTGTVLEDIMVLYNSGSYTGSLVKFWNNTMPCVNRCFFGPVTPGTLTSANHALDLGDINTIDVVNTTFGMRAAYGRQTSAGYSNLAYFRDCTFSTRAATNPGLDWLFDHCDFELPGLPAGDAVITTDGFLYDSNDRSGNVTVRDSAIYDTPGTGQYFVRIPSNVPVSVSLKNVVEEDSAPGNLAAFCSHLGTGNLEVIECGTGNLIDCGDGTISTSKKQLVRVVGNSLSNTVTNPLVLHTTAHFESEVHSNTLKSGNNVVQTDSLQTIGHERSDVVAVPAVAVHAGVTNVTASIFAGSDGMGVIALHNTAGAPSTTGLMADVTMANPWQSVSPSTGNTSLQFPLVQVTPFIVGDGGNNFPTQSGPASAACQPYASTTAIRGGGTQGAWSLGINVAIPATTWVAFAYRVVHL